MARPNKQESALTRDKILDAAEFEFLEKGFSRSTLNGIAKRAGVTRGAIYWHFSDKVAIFEAILERVQLPLEAIFEAAERDSEYPLQALHQLCYQCLLQLAQCPQSKRVHTILFHRCERVDELGDFVERENHMRLTMQQRVESLIKHAQQKGQVRSDSSPEVLAWAMKSYIMGIYNLFLRAPDEVNLEQEAENILDVFFQGLQVSTE